MKNLKKQIKRSRSNRKSVDDLYYEHQKQRTILSTKDKYDFVDAVFLNKKAFGALIKTNRGLIGRIYKTKVDNGKYSVYFNGEPTSNLFLFDYEFNVINYF